MSAVQILTVVGSCVQIQLGRTHVAAVQVIHLILMDAPAMVQLKLLFPNNFIVTIYIQILMNVLEVAMSVLRLVQTLLGVIHVHVTLAIVWQVIDKLVLVSGNCSNK